MTSPERGREPGQRPSSPAPGTRPCVHCGVLCEVPDPDDGRDLFCCTGCEMAHAIIQGAGLQAYYADRDALPPKPGGRRVEGWDKIPRVELSDGSLRCNLRIDGLNCAACVWVTEKVLEQTPGVKEAMVSYATGRAEVRWDPGVVDLDAVLGRVAALGYQPRALDAAPAHDRDLLLRLGVAVFAAANVMMLSTSIYLGWWQGMDERHATLLRWLSLVLATPVAFWSAAPFFRGAWGGLRHGMLHMDLPLSLGVTILYGHGLVATQLGRDAYFDSLTMLVALLLAGRVVEHRGRRRASEAATAMAAQAPRIARRVVGESLEMVSPDALVPGDLVEVAAGEEIAADGKVARGQGTVQRALLTGESHPVAVGVGDAVVAGAVLEDGALRVAVEAAAGETLLARMAAGLQESVGRPEEPTLADRIAPWFTGTTLLLAMGAFLGWALAFGFDRGMQVAVAVLVVACPCALALAHPLASAAGLGVAARRGLLFRSAGTLRTLAGVDLVVLDKTGTVTGGLLVVVEADDAVLRVAAGIERSSVHPIGRAIVDEAVRRGIPIPQSHGVQEVPGKGIAGWVDGVFWTIRSAGPGEVEVEGLGRIGLRDTLRPDAVTTIARLRALGLDVVLLTGDHEAVGRRIARAAGVDTVFGGVGPEDKARWIRARRQEGHVVLYAGDGLNDGPALGAADVAVAMGSGAASSVLVADAVIGSPLVGPILAGVHAARVAVAVTKANLRRSLLYNLASVALALMGWVNPLVAAVLMPLSSLLVLAGALGVERRVRRLEAS